MSLTVENLCKSYGGLRVVDKVSFAVPEQGLTGLIGPNGAGKSTLFAMISGFQQADAGRVSFAGQEIHRDTAVVRARRGLARTFQVPRPFTHLTVLENLMVGASDQPGERIMNLVFRPAAVRECEQRIAARANELLDFLGLTRVGNSPAGKLSGGQQKLLELGRALMTEPRFILLDEPYAGVNPVLIEEIESRIRILAERGTGFLIVEHNLPALARLASRLLVMDRGKLIADDTPTAVLANPIVQDAYIGGTP